MPDCNRSSGNQFHDPSLHGCEPPHLHRIAYVRRVLWDELQADGV